MIKIPEPCTADWQGMTPQKDRRFCVSCEKVVVDFTRMTDEDIKTYFASYAEQKTCGRFADTQLNRPLTEKASSLNTLYNRIQQTDYRFFFKQTALFFVGSMIWLSSCVRRTAHVVGELAADDTTKYCQPTHLTGDTVYMIPEPEPLKGAVMYVPEDTLAAPVDTSALQGIEPVDHVWMGKVAYPIPDKHKKKKNK